MDLIQSGVVHDVKIKATRHIRYEYRVVRSSLRTLERLTRKKK